MDHVDKIPLSANKNNSRRRAPSYWWSDDGVISNNARLPNARRGPLEVLIIIPEEPLPTADLLLLLRFRLFCPPRESDSPAADR